MKALINPFAHSRQLMQQMIEFDESIAASGLERGLNKLDNTQASQITGGAYCSHMHTCEARTARETEDRPYLLNARHESPLYSARERAALAWAKSLTLVSAARTQFYPFGRIK